MSQTFLYDLIVAITNRGHAPTVMDAARSAGAMGGTIIHARGTNPQGETSFFGLSIAEEKDMLIILCAANQKTALMRAIMEKAGVNSPAHTVMFALPVDSVAGLQSVIAAAGETVE
jgi:nitrogen regulatory protein PII